MVSECGRASIFEKLYGIISNEIRSLSSPNGTVSTLRCAAVSLLRWSVEMRRAIREFCEGGRGLAIDRHLSARDVGAAKGRSGCRARGLRKSGAAGAEQPGRTQLSGLGFARAGRDRFRDRSFPVRGETEFGFCAGAHEFLHGALPKRRRGRRAAGGERSSATGDGRFGDSSNAG